MSTLTSGVRWWIQCHVALILPGSLSPVWAATSALCLAGCCDDAEQGVSVTAWGAGDLRPHIPSAPLSCGPPLADLGRDTRKPPQPDPEESTAPSFGCPSPHNGGGGVWLPPACLSRLQEDQPHPWRPSPGSLALATSSKSEHCLIPRGCRSGDRPGSAQMPCVWEIGNC